MRTISVILLMLLVKTLSAQQNLTSNTPYQGQFGTGSYIVYGNNGTLLSQVDKPIIVVEGLDLLNNVSSNDIAFFLNQNYTNQIGAQLLYAGYDVVTLNFTDASDYIQRNAFVLVELINQVNTQKQGSEPITVIGLSTGGIIARYALARMGLQKSNRFLMVHGQTMHTLA